jgi:Regulator of Chromosome Condensation (RCC1) repeat protein
MRRVIPLLAFVAACASSSDAGGPTSELPVRHLTLVSGDLQSSTIGYFVSSPIVLKVTDANGAAVAGAQVHFTVDTIFRSIQYQSTGVNGAVYPVGPSDSSGQVTVHWRLGPASGVQHFTAIIDSSRTPESVQVTATASTMSVLALDGGAQAMCAIDLQGNLGCWSPPLLAPGGPAPRFIPAAASVTFTGLAMSNKGSRTPKGCALASTGKPWCFTFNESTGAAGLTELGGSYPALASIYGAGSTGDTYCGLDGGGAAWCWGGNFLGVIGDGSESARVTPVAVATAARFVSVNVGDDEACGLTADGQAWCWGNNSLEQVGAHFPSGGTVAVLPTLVATSSRFSRLGLFSGGNATCGLATDGVYCWGDVTNLGTTVGVARPDTTPTPRLMVAGTFAGLADAEPAFLLLRQDGSLLAQTYDRIAGPLFSFGPAGLLSGVMTPHSSGLVCGPGATIPGTVCMATEMLSDFRVGIPGVFGVPSP